MAQAQTGKPTSTAKSAGIKPPSKSLPTKNASTAGFEAVVDAGTNLTESANDKKKVKPSPLWDMHGLTDEASPRDVVSGPEITIVIQPGISIDLPGGESIKSNNRVTPGPDLEPGEPQKDEGRTDAPVKPPSFRKS